MSWCSKSYWKLMDKLTSQVAFPFLKHLKQLLLTCVISMAWDQSSIIQYIPSPRLAFTCVPSHWLKNSRQICAWMASLLGASCGLRNHGMGYQWRNERRQLKRTRENKNKVTVRRCLVGKGSLKMLLLLSYFLVHLLSTSLGKSLQLMEAVCCISESCGSTSWICSWFPL